MKKPTSVAFLTNFNGNATAHNRWSKTTFEVDFPTYFLAKSAVARLNTAISPNFFVLNAPNGEILSRKHVEFFGTVVGSWNQLSIS